MPIEQDYPMFNKVWWHCSLFCESSIKSTEFISKRNHLTNSIDSSLQTSTENNRPIFIIKSTTSKTSNESVSPSTQRNSVPSTLNWRYFCQLRGLWTSGNCNESWERGHRFNLGRRKIKTPKGLARRSEAWRPKTRLEAQHGYADARKPQAVQQVVLQHQACYSGRTKCQKQEVHCGDEV